MKKERKKERGRGERRPLGHRIMKRISSLSRLHLAMSYIKKSREPGFTARWGHRYRHMEHGRNMAAFGRSICGAGCWLAGYAPAAGKLQSGLKHSEAAIRVSPLLMSAWRRGA